MVIWLPQEWPGPLSAWPSEQPSWPRCLQAASVCGAPVSPASPLLFPVSSSHLSETGTGIEAGVTKSGKSPPSHDSWTCRSCQGTRMKHLTKHQNSLKKKKKSETESKFFFLVQSQSSEKKIQNTQEINSTLFNWTKQNKTYTFSRQSSFSSYLQQKNRKTNN